PVVEVPRVPPTRGTPAEERRGERPPVAVPGPVSSTTDAPGGEGTRGTVDGGRPPGPDEEGAPRSQGHEDVRRAGILERPRGRQGRDDRLPVEVRAGGVQHGVDESPVDFDAVFPVFLAPHPPREPAELRLVRDHERAALQQLAVHVPVLPPRVEQDRHARPPRGPREAEVDGRRDLALQHQEGVGRHEAVEVAVRHVVEVGPAVGVGPPGDHRADLPVRQDEHVSSPRRDALAPPRRRRVDARPGQRALEGRPGGIVAEPPQERRPHVVSREPRRGNGLVTPLATRDVLPRPPSGEQRQVLPRGREPAHGQEGVGVDAPGDQYRHRIGGGAGGEAQECDERADRRDGAGNAAAGPQCCFSPRVLPPRRTPREDDVCHEQDRRDEDRDAEGEVRGYQVDALDERRTPGTVVRETRRPPAAPPAEAGQPRRPRPEAAQSGAPEGRPQDGPRGDPPVPPHRLEIVQAFEWAMAPSFVRPPVLPPPLDLLRGQCPLTQASNQPATGPTGQGHGPAQGKNCAVSASAPSPVGSSRSGSDCPIFAWDAMRRDACFGAGAGSAVLTVVPDRLTKWPVGKPSAWGSRNGPQNGPGGPVMRAIVEIRLWPPSETALRSAKRDRGRRSMYLDVVVRMGRKVASWRALAEVYK
ncbi:hypothetical protein THAOC_37107, partial [Thalassiosira oceanica]